MPWWSLKVAMTTFPRSLYLYNISRGQLSSDTPHCRLCSGIPISWRCNVVTRTSPPFPILTPRHLPFLVCYLTQTSDLRAQRVELVVEAPPYPILAVHGGGDEHRKGTDRRTFFHPRVWKWATFLGVRRGGEIDIIPLRIVGTGFGLAITLNGNHLGSGRARLRAKRRTARTVR